MFASIALAKLKYPAEMALNSFQFCSASNPEENQRMLAELRESYSQAQTLDEIHAVILKAVECDCLALHQAAILCKEFGIYDQALLYLPDEPMILQAA